MRIGPAPLRLPGTPKPCLPIRIPVPMPNPVAEKKRTAGHFQSSRSIRFWRKKKAVNRILELGGNLLIRIETENPGLESFFCRRIFLGDMLFPRFTENAGPVLLRNPIRPIGHIIIHHHNDIGYPPPNALQSPANPGGIRSGDQANRDGERSGHFRRLSEGGGRTTLGESTRRRGWTSLFFEIAGQVPERSIGLAWKACVG